MKTVRKYSDINDALFDRSWLEANGISSFIPEEISASSALPHVGVYSEIRLQVAEEDLAEAESMLTQRLDDASDVGQASDAGYSIHGLSENGFRSLVILDFSIYAVFFLVSYLESLGIPEATLEYVSSQYLSYGMANLVYYIYWPIVMLHGICWVGLFYFRKWARGLYLFLMIESAIAALFGMAFIAFPLSRFLGFLSVLLAGVLLSVLYLSDLWRSKVLEANKTD